MDPEWSPGACHRKHVEPVKWSSKSELAVFYLTSSSWTTPRRCLWLHSSSIFSRERRDWQCRTPSPSPGICRWKIYFDRLIPQFLCEDVSAPWKLSDLFWNRTGRLRSWKICWGINPAVRLTDWPQFYEWKFQDLDVAFWNSIICISAINMLFTIYNFPS